MDRQNYRFLKDTRADYLFILFHPVMEFEPPGSFQHSFFYFFLFDNLFHFFLNHHVAVLCRSRANNNLLIRFVMFFYVLECKIILFNISKWLTVPSNLLTFNFYYPKYP